MLPLQSIIKEKVNGPLTVAGDCRAVGRAKVADLLRYVTQVGHVPDGGRELSVEDVAR
jgi:hypothetical protein